MSRKGLIVCLIVFIALSCSVLLADPVAMTMDDLEQIGDTQKGNNNKLNEAIDLTGITDLEWAGDWCEASNLLVWDYNEGLFWWFGPGELTHISVKAGNSWILYELASPLQAGGFIYLESEIFNKNGEAKAIGHVTGYYSASSIQASADPKISASVASVPEPGTIFLLGLGILAIPVYRKRMAS